MCPRQEECPKSVGRGSMALARWTSLFEIWNLIFNKGSDQRRGCAGHPRWNWLVTRPRDQCRFGRGQGVWWCQPWQQQWQQRPPQRQQSDLTTARPKNPGHCLLSATFPYTFALAMSLWFFLINVLCKTRSRRRVDMTRLQRERCRQKEMNSSCFFIPLHRTTGCLLRGTWPTHFFHHMVLTPVQIRQTCPQGKLCGQEPNNNRMFSFP